MVYLVWIIILSIFNFQIVFQFCSFRTRRGKQLLFIKILYMCVCVGGALFSQICYLNDWKVMDIPLGAVVKTLYMLFTFFVIGNLIQDGWVRLVFATAVSDFFMMLAEMLESVLYYWLVSYGKSESYYINPYRDFALQSILVLGCAFLFWFIFMKIFRRWCSYSFERLLFTKLFAVFYIILGGSSLIKSISVILYDKKSFAADVIGIGGIAVVFVILLSGERNHMLRQKNFHLCLQQQMMKEHIQLMEEQIAMTRKYRHDIQKHLDALSYFSSQIVFEQNDMVQEYRDRLKEMYRELLCGDYSQCQDVNMALFQLEKYCKKNHLIFQTRLKEISFEIFSSKERTNLMLYAVNWIIGEHMHMLKNANKMGKYLIDVYGDNAVGNHTIVMSISGEGKWNIDEIHKFFAKQSQKNTELISQIRKVLKCYGGFVKVEKKPAFTKLILNWNGEK